MSVLERIEISPSEQFAENLASLSQETNRIPDPYYFNIINNELFSPTAYCRIKDTVEDKTSHPGALEYQAVVAIEEWAAKNDKGTIVWISPGYPGVYPVLKIIVSEIGYTNNTKRLFNRAVLFDFDQQQSMKLAWNLTSFSKNEQVLGLANKPICTSLDQIRATPFVLDTRDKSWIEILEGLIPDPKLWESIRQGEDIIAKNMALERVRMIQKELFFSSRPISYTQAQREISQMMGPHAPSCPSVNTIGRTALQVFSENAFTYLSSSIIKNPDFCEQCPVCKVKIRCIVKQGQSCPSCKTVKRCG